MPPQILLDPHFRALDVIFYPQDLARLKQYGTVLWAKDEAIPPNELEKIQADINIIITGRWRYGDVTRFPNLQAILEVSGGFPTPDVLDYAACFGRNIRVLSCAPAFGPVVAEMGLTMALAAARKLVWNHEAFRQDQANWSHTDPGNTFTLYDKQVGFIGFGGLARNLKPLLAPFRCPIQVYDPWLTDTYLRTQGVAPVDIDTLLSTSRIIFVLAVPSAGNKAFLDREKLEKIPSDAVFVLLSRSHVVDFEALAELIWAERFRAAIDVFPEEPLPFDHPIAQAPNVILSSHRAGAIHEGLQNIGVLVANDVEALSQGLVPQQMQVAQPEFIRLRAGK